VARKPKTQSQRRDEFFDALDALHSAARDTGYKQGCRAANPDRYDNADMWKREDAANHRAYMLQSRCVSMFNAAVRAARRA
jgi:hypothetical protein